MRKQRFVKPLEVTLPNGCTALARLRFPGSGRELPPSGGMVPTSGREGSWWTRRIAEGSAAEVEPKKSEAPAEPVTRDESEG